MAPAYNMELNDKNGPPDRKLQFVDISVRPTATTQTILRDNRCFPSQGRAKLELCRISTPPA